MQGGECVSVCGRGGGGASSLPGSASGAGRRERRTQGFPPWGGLPAIGSTACALWLTPPLAACRTGRRRGPYQRAAAAWGGAGMGVCVGGGGGGGGGGRPPPPPPPQTHPHAARPHHTQPPPRTAQHTHLANVLCHLLHAFHLVRQQAALCAREGVRVVWVGGGGVWVAGVGGWVGGGAAGEGGRIARAAPLLPATPTPPPTHPTTHTNHPHAGARPPAPPARSPTKSHIWESPCFSATSCSCRSF